MTTRQSRRSKFSDTLASVRQPCNCEERQYPNGHTSALEKEIDELVYQLYGLTEDEVKIVEER